MTDKYIYELIQSDSQDLIVRNRQRFKNDLAEKWDWLARQKEVTAVPHFSSRHCVGTANGVDLPPVRGAQCCRFYEFFG